MSPPGSGRVWSPSGARGESEATCTPNGNRPASAWRACGHAWLDTGTHTSLIEAAPEEVAYKMGFIDAEQVLRMAAVLGSSIYAVHLRGVADE